MNCLPHARAAACLKQWKRQSPPPLFSITRTTRRGELRGPGEWPPESSSSSSSSSSSPGPADGSASGSASGPDGSSSAPAGLTPPPPEPPGIITLRAEILERRAGLVNLVLTKATTSIAAAATTSTEKSCCCVISNEPDKTLLVLFLITRKMSPRVNNGSRQNPNRPVCAACRKRLSFVFSACVCKRLFCRSCIPQAAHACTELPLEYDVATCDDESAK